MASCYKYLSVGFTHPWIFYHRLEVAVNNMSFASCQCFSYLPLRTDSLHCTHHWYFNPVLVGYESLPTYNSKVYEKETQYLHSGIVASDKKKKQSKKSIKRACSWIFKGPRCEPWGTPPEVTHSFPCLVEQTLRLKPKAAVPCVWRIKGATDQKFVHPYL